MLVRIDPRQRATTVLSIPRDLAVEIPGRGLAKINETYTIGGLDLTTRTVKRLLSTDDESFRVNHAVATTFGGFVDAVNQLHCVYIDVDRRYYHTNAGLPVSQHWSEINVRAGYQRLCGTEALRTSASAISTTTSCAPPASRASCAPRRTSFASTGCWTTCGRWCGSSRARRRPTRTCRARAACCGSASSRSSRAASRCGRSASPRRSSCRARRRRSAPTRSSARTSPRARRRSARAVREFMHPSAPKKPVVRERRTRRAGAGAAPARRSPTGLRDATAQAEALVRAAPSRKRTRMPIHAPRRLTARGSFPASTPRRPTRVAT